MNAQHFARAHPILISIAPVLLCIAMSGCQPKPQSMFEQQAEVESAQEIGAPVSDSSETKVARVDGVRPITSQNLASSDIEIIKQQALARQPNCDIGPCQYFELNIVDFSPKQPWLTSIMWQTIAHILAPEMPLASQDEAAKKIILMLLNQIEYGESTVSTRPMYQRIDTEVVFNPVPDLTDIESTPTGYLAIRSSVSKEDSHEQFNYVMLDMQKKLQLNIEDILLPEVRPDDLLATFQTAKKDWLTLQGVEAKYLDDWPLQLSKQWYLDKEGLHMVYQSGELLKDNIGAVDLLVPYALLQGLLKPSYRVYSKQIS